MAITKLYKVRRKDDPEALSLLGMLRAASYAVRSVRIEHVLWVETKQSLTNLAALGQLWCNPITEKFGAVTHLTKAVPVREVSYKRSMTDPEWPTARHACQTLGIADVVWMRISKRYAFSGVSEEVADSIASRFLYNRETQMIIPPGFEWDTLVPQGEVGPIEWFDVQGMSLVELRQLSETRRLHMRDDQLWAMRDVFVRLHRPARDGEIEMIAAGWGDHCAHTTFKSLQLLQRIQAGTHKINHPLVVSAFDDNSGVMHFYADYSIAVKGETHISPTFAGDPYGGVSTKHGGVIRDVIGTGQGASPIAGTTIMATTDPAMPLEEVPAGAFHPQIVLRESIRGTYEYTNPMGIPMAYARYLKHPRNWKGLALGHSIGLIPTAYAKKGVPEDGDFVLLIGGSTGADGLHGATVSSGQMTEATVSVDAAHVQIGAPIEQRKFMEAIPKLRDADCIRAITDCGAAGLASAVGEMGSGTGVEVNLAWVPLKTAGLRPWQIWLSESQERMVLAVPPERVRQAREILIEYDVPVATIGRFTSSNRCVVYYDDNKLSAEYDPSTILVDLPYEVLTQDCPLPKISVSVPDKPTDFFVLPPATAEEWKELAVRVLGHYNIADQSWAARRFDQTVQGATVIPYIHGRGERMPDELFACTPVLGKPWVMGCANAVNQLYTAVDPNRAAILIYTQAVAKLVAAGFSPDDIVTCANVYTPSVLDSSVNAAALVQLVDGYVQASVDLGVPVITGKDSSSGTFKTADERIDAPLTLDVMAVGRMPNVGRLIPKAFQKPGHKLWLLHSGIENARLGGSILYDTFSQTGEALSELDLVEVRDGLRRYAKFAKTGAILSRSNISEGGILRSVFESCLGSGLGCRIDLEMGSNPVVRLFAEYSSAILFATEGDEWRNFFADYEVQSIGEVIQEPVVQVSVNHYPLFEATIEELSGQWSKTFTEVVA